MKSSDRRRRRVEIDRRLDDLDEKIAQEKRDREVQGASDDEEIQRLGDRQDELATDHADLRRRVQRLEAKAPIRPGRPRKTTKN